MSTQPTDRDVSSDESSGDAGAWTTVPKAELAITPGGGGDDDDDDASWIVHGVALGPPDSYTEGKHGRKYWPAASMREAAASLAGSDVTFHAEDPTDHGGERIGRVERTAFEPGVGVLYEARLSNQGVARNLSLGQLDVSIEATPTPDADLPTDDTGAMTMDAFEFTGLAVVQNGAARGNYTASGPAADNRAIAALSASDIESLLAHDSDSDATQIATEPSDELAASSTGPDSSAPMTADGEADPTQTESSYTPNMVSDVSETDATEQLDSNDTGTDSTESPPSIDLDGRAVIDDDQLDQLKGAAEERDGLQNELETLRREKEKKDERIEAQNEQLTHLGNEAVAQLAAATGHSAEFYEDFSVKKTLAELGRIHGQETADSDGATAAASAADDGAADGGLSDAAKGAAVLAKLKAGKSLDQAVRERETGSAATASLSAEQKRANDLAEGAMFGEDALRVARHDLQPAEFIRDVYDADPAEFDHENDLRDELVEHKDTKAVNRKRAALDREHRKRRNAELRDRIHGDLADRHDDPTEAQLAHDALKGTERRRRMAQSDRDPADYIRDEFGIDPRQFNDDVNLRDAIDEAADN
jgi:hypothetical protein